MNASLEINGKKLLTIKEASSQISYSRDYITRLARDRKVVGTQIGRIWYVDLDSVKNYQQVAEHEQEIKKRLLSDERKKDLGIKSAKQALRRERVINHKQASVAVASFTSLVVTVGVLSGVWLGSGWETLSDNFVQTANVKQSIIPSDNYVELLTKEAAIEISESESYQVHSLYNFAPSEFTDVESGYVLLPQSGSQAIEEYFSDPVTTIVKENGETVLVKVDENGKPYGQEIPFVSVPVNHLNQ